MIQKLIHSLLLRRHFWRYASFPEVAEIYASRTMVIFALRIVATFASVYLYLEGYNLLFLSLLWAAFYGLKVIFAYPAARIVAYFGPKHGIFVSSVIFAIAMFVFQFTGDHGLTALVPWLILHAFAGSLNNLSYHVDFSKVKHSDHAGKEIGFMNILEKVANGLSPLVGGILAFLAGPEVVMMVAAALFLVASIPLFLTTEPTMLKQSIDFRGFPWRTTWRSMVADIATGWDVFSTASAWTLFMAIIVFSGNGDEMYAKIGALASLSLFVALAASYAFGRLIDNRRGRELLLYSTIANSGVHVLRAFITTPAGVAAVNVMNEASTTGFSMAFMRGMYDTADITGKRIAYLFMMEIGLNLGAMFGALLLAVLCVFVGDVLSLKIFFIIVAAVTLFIATPRFALYRK